MTSRTTQFTRGAIAFALVISLVACGDDDGDADDTGSTNGDTAADVTPDEETTNGGTEDEGNSDAGTAGTVEIVAVDFGFEGVPGSVPAGTQLTLRNDADAELHELVAFRLDDAEDRSVEEIVHLAPEEMQQVLGEPATVILAPPSSEQVATPIGDGTLTEPGRYALICMIPTGVDPDEYMAAAADSDGPPDVGDSPPHIVHGMYAEIEVE